MAALAYLPEELWALVVKALTPQNLSRSRLAELCRVSKRFQACFEYHLYQSPKWRFEKDENIFGLFMRTLVRRPELCTHIQSITIEGYEDDIDACLPEASIEEAAPMLLEVAKMLPNNTLAKDVAMSISEGRLDGILVILLAITPYLTFLSVDYCMRCPLALVGAFFTSLSNAGTSYELSRLRNLKTLRFPNSADWRIVDYGPRGLSMWSIFQLQTLKEVDFVFCNPSHSSQPILSDPLPLLNISHLRITNIYGANNFEDLQDLQLILLASPHLTSMEYFFVQDFYNLQRDEDYDTDFGFDNYWALFAKALSTVSSTLKELIISLDYSTDRDDESNEDMIEAWRCRGQLGALDFLPKLERIELPIFVLIGWDSTDSESLTLFECIPRQLKELCLRDDLSESRQGSSRDRYRVKFPVELSECLSHLAQLRTKGDASHSLEALHFYTRPIRTHDYEGSPIDIWAHSSLVMVQRLCAEAHITCCIHMLPTTTRGSNMQPVHLITLYDRLEPESQLQEIKTCVQRAEIVYERTKVFQFDTE